MKANLCDNCRYQPADLGECYSATAEFLCLDCPNTKQVTTAPIRRVRLDLGLITDPGRRRKILYDRMRAHRARARRVRMKDVTLQGVWHG